MGKGKLLGAAFLVGMLAVMTAGCARYEPAPASSPGSAFEPAAPAVPSAGALERKASPPSPRSAFEPAAASDSPAAKWAGRKEGAGENGGAAVEREGPGPDFKAPALGFWCDGYFRSAAQRMEKALAALRPEPVKVKGIYISGYAAGNDAMMEEYIRRIDETELNAVVIDFKNDEGRITYPVNTGLMGEIGAGTKLIPDLEGLLSKLKEHDIYAIARVVAFKDPFLASRKPEWCLRTADGEIYRDKKGQAWINPYLTEVWEYLAEAAADACRAGFDEVQFDYIRFDTDPAMSQVVFDQADTAGRSKTEAVTAFAEFLRERFKRTGLFLSADVFGAVIGNPVDADAVGQDYVKLAESMDYICPMIYPSHYGAGSFGLENPDLHPYETIAGALAKSREALEDGAEAEYNVEYDAEAAAGLKDGGDEAENEAGNAKPAPRAAVRPWLQDFTASYLKRYLVYGPEELRQQIQAVYDSGCEEWILWNAACRYSWDGLLKEEEYGQNAGGGGILPPL